MLNENNGYGLKMTPINIFIKLYKIEQLVKLKKIIIEMKKHSFYTKTPYTVVYLKYKLN